MPARALSFLCFAKEKKAKERRLRAQVWLRQTSLPPHSFSGGLATCGYAASNMQALVPRKTALRSAAPAGGGTAQPIVPNVLFLTLKEAIFIFISWLYDICIHKRLPEKYSPPLFK